MNIILLGPPGSGKGTQAELLAKKFNLHHISSGALLRNAIKQGDAKAQAIKGLMDKGELVPFDTILDLILDEIKKSPQGFILDGTPRNLAQAEHMDWFFKENDITVDKIIICELPDEVGIKRMVSRAEKENRSDDTPETIKHRFQVYHQETEPVLDHYKNSGKIITVDARPDVETIHQEILKQLKD